MPLTSVSLNALVKRLFERHFEHEDRRDVLSFPKVSPVLRPGATNRIIVYHGSFNPPHRGHLETLYVGRSPFHAVAAFVIPNADDRVYRKATSQGFDIVLPETVRYDIWREATKGDNWTYVCRKDESTVTSLIEDLPKLAAKYGIEVKMYSLLGSDYFNGTPDDYDYNGGSVFTDWSRKMNPDGFVGGVPKKLSDHGGWVKREIGGDSEAAVWVSKCESSEHEMYFIQRPPADGPRDVSSTEIRKVMEMWNNHDTRMQRALLESAVLSPEVLERWLKSEEVGES